MFFNKRLNELNNRITLLENIINYYKSCGDCGHIFDHSYQVVIVIDEHGQEGTRYYCKKCKKPYDIVKRYFNVKNISNPYMNRVGERYYRKSKEVEVKIKENKHGKEKRKQAH